MRTPLRWLDERQIGWRQITAQILYVVCVSAFVVSLLIYGSAP
ncbi:hypothetical protein [Streptomyces sp. NPDC001020]